ncbi:hypothetical protein ACHAP8_003732 [Fusarium lateritium]
MTYKKNQVEATSAQKADFTDIYNQQNPRAYFTTLAPLEYTIPQQVRPLFQRLHQLSSQATRASAILDVCCSYGINGGLLRHHLDLGTWTAHYTNTSPEKQIQADKKLFASRQRSPKPIVFGLDKAENALRYALDAGLIDNGWAEDLEVQDPSPNLCRALKDVSLVISTGGVGYVTSRTFARIMAVVGKGKVWVASTVIRTASYNDIASALKQYGLVTENLPGLVLRQRRFASAQEQNDAVAHVLARGLDPIGYEDQGYLCAEVFVSRPVESTSMPPIAELVAEFGCMRNGI